LGPTLRIDKIMKHITCSHCGDTYPDFDVAHVCSRGLYAPELNKNIKAGADIHAGDGGYSLGTQKKYNEFVKGRNQSLAKMRIRDFEKESGLEIFGLGAKRHIWEAALEKYAALVVEECAQRAEAYAYMSQNFNALAEELRRMNGVEE
jgi:hypothetical protein